jgi:acetyltransferase
MPRQAGLDAIFRPRSVAVIGAGREPGGIGRTVFEGLLGYGFEGTVYPVNPKATQVRSVRAWPSVEAIPEPVDMAVICVPVQHVQAVAEQCARKGVKGLVVITAGFREVGGEGEEKERRLLELVRSSGMRMVGPNCMGVINTEPAVHLHATFTKRTAEHGVISFMSQSGALGEGVLEHVAAHQIGLSKFVSLGNRADVSPNDLLEQWGEDPLTEVVLMYVESFGNPRNFIRIASEVARRKPVLVVKSGRTSAGARAARSHTGSLAESEQAVEAMLRQCGVIRIKNVQELFDTASAFAAQPLPKGRRVAIVTNGGGPGIMATDALVGAGLSLAELSEPTKAALKKLLPDEASVQNPVDMIAGAGAETYREACRLVAADEAVDAMMVIHVSIDDSVGEAVARGILDGVKAPGKTVVCCLFGAPADAPAFAVLSRGGVPTYTFPENAAVSLAHLAHYREMASRPISAPEAVKADREGARAIVAAHLTSERIKLPDDEARRLAEKYGFRFPKERMVATPGEVANAGAEIGFPLVLKAQGREIVHKTEVGAVALGIKNPEELEKRFAAMLSSLRSHGLQAESFLLQEMAAKGHEMFVGISRDPAFGPIIAVGSGGIYLEVLKDVSFGVLPLARADAERMVRSLRSFPILEGARGGPRADLSAVVDAVLAAAALAHDSEEIAELDLNPLMVYPEGKGLVAVDARAFVAPPERG